MAQAAAHGLRPFSMTGDNVNGLAIAAKRRPFFAWLQQQAFDVVMLAETHSISQQQFQRWVRQGAGQGRPWQGFSYSHSKPRVPGERVTAGVAVLLSSRIVKPDTEPVVEYTDGAGRVLRVAWTTPWGQQMAAVAVYAPVDHTERAAWFEGPLQEALESGALGSSMMVGGDFNCAMQEVDVQPAAGMRPRQSSRMVGAVQLQQVTSRSGLVDAWRHHNPHARQPTHYSYNPSTASGNGGGSRQGGGGQAAAHAATSAGRIDYVFLSADLVDAGWLQKATQHRRYPADHRPVVVKLQPPNMPLLGQSRWRFPNAAMADPVFVTALQDSLDAAIQQQQQQRVGGG
jgi:exonuclease III